MEQSDAESAHRTNLAAERTWLAWWRTALAAAAAGLAVGRLLPDIASGTTWPYVALGAGYSLAAVGFMIAGGVRQGRMRRARRDESFAEVDRRLVTVFSIAGALLTMATLAVVVANA